MFHQFSLEEKQLNSTVLKGWEEKDSTERKNRSCILRCCCITEQQIHEQLGHSGFFLNNNFFLLFIKVGFPKYGFSSGYTAYTFTELMRFCSPLHLLFVSKVKFRYPTLFSEVQEKY